MWRLVSGIIQGRSTVQSIACPVCLFRPRIITIWNILVRVHLPCSNLGCKSVQLYDTCCTFCYTLNCGESAVIFSCLISPYRIAFRTHPPKIHLHHCYEASQYSTGECLRCTYKSTVQPYPWFVKNALLCTGSNHPEASSCTTSSSRDLTGSSPESYEHTGCGLYCSCMRGSWDGPS